MANNKITWLQCTIDKEEWEALNARRLALNLKWADLLPPAVKAYLDKLEATQSSARKSVRKSKKAARSKAK
jgi:hypothetical protein